MKATRGPMKATREPMKAKPKAMKSMRRPARADPDAKRAKMTQEDLNDMANGTFVDPDDTTSAGLEPWEAETLAEVHGTDEAATLAVPGRRDRNKNTFFNAMKRKNQLPEWMGDALAKIQNSGLDS